MLVSSKTYPLAYETQVHDRAVRPHTHQNILNSTLGASVSDVWVESGRYSLIIAADIPSRSQYGHFAEFPGDTITVLVQVPTANGEIPDHDLLHMGPCGWRR
jgi:hypothetical protein